MDGEEKCYQQKDVGGITTKVFEGMYRIELWYFWGENNIINTLYNLHLLDVKIDSEGMLDTTRSKTVLGLSFVVHSVWVEINSGRQHEGTRSYGRCKSWGKKQVKNVRPDMKINTKKTS